MELVCHIFAFFALVLFPLYAIHEVDALNYVSVDSGDDRFVLQWAYNNSASKLFFNMTCKALGWCAVGFTTTANGRNMVNYDIAAGGLASNTPYLDDYWSTSTGVPSNDVAQNLHLITASEAGGFTTVEFDRDTTTGDNNDVLFTSDTLVWILWAFHSSNEADAGLSSPKHTDKGGLLPNVQHNLIAEAMSAGIHPSTTVMTSSTSSVSTTATPTPTTMGTAVHEGESLESDGGDFKLQWAYNNGTLIFNMTCKTTGWCAVGFTLNDGGRNMVNYDIAVGGVASDRPYIYDYWSTSIGPPSKDAKQNFNLIMASEDDGYTNVQFDRDVMTGDDNDVQFTTDTKVWIAWALNSADGNMDLTKHITTGVFPNGFKLEGGAVTKMNAASDLSAGLPEVGTPTRDPTPDYILMKATGNNGYTNVEFYRNATTDGDSKDVQFTKNTEVWIVWAWRNNDDANSGISKHSIGATGVSSKKYNLIKEAMSAGMQPTSTTSTTKNAASDVASRVVTYATLALSACVLSL